MASQTEAACRALREAGCDAALLMPALCGCPNCRTVRMIAVPARFCADCGAELEVLPATAATPALVDLASAA